MPKWEGVPGLEGILGTTLSIISSEGHYNWMLLTHNLLRECRVHKSAKGRAKKPQRCWTTSLTCSSESVGWAEAHCSKHAPPLLLP